VNRQELTRIAVAPPPTWRVWWLNPSVAFSIPAVITGVAAYVTAASAYAKYWRTAKYFDLPALSLLLGAVLVFVCGCVLGAARRSDASRNAPTDWKDSVRWPAVRLLFTLSFVLTLVAYVVWFCIAIKNGLRFSVISEVLHGVSGATYNLRDQYLATIPGVTTATQFGIAVIGLGVPLGAAFGWRRVRWQMAIVFALSVVRAFLNSERLAIIELLVPFIVSYIWLCPPASPRGRKLTRIAPVAGPVLLYFFFAAAEYFRSWKSFYVNRESSFWSFIGLRLTGYYTTALNNGALVWKVKDPLAYQGAPQTLDFLWRFPVINHLMPILVPYFHVSLSNSEVHYADLLTAAANLELNNPSGIFGPVVDYGVIGGLLYWLLCGLVCGYLYKEFTQRTAAGIFLYPMLFISLIEAPRVLYWAEGRFFPPMFLLVFSVLFVFRTQRAAPLYRPLLMDKVPG
jgi:oligosaccharide repeat unit polymerase